MSTALSPGTEHRCGLARVTRIWSMSRATVYRYRSRTPMSRKRRGPIGAMADTDLVSAIERQLAASPFHGEGCRQTLRQGLGRTP